MYMEQVMTKSDIQTKPLTLFEQHVFNESLKHNLDYSDLYYATLCIEAKYKGNSEDEQMFAREVNHSTDHLWHEAYFCALFHKTSKYEKWKYHIPNMDDIVAVNQSINSYRYD